ncbi:MAG: OmpH family outer membrane protein [bacterium]
MKIKMSAWWSAVVILLVAALGAGIAESQPAESNSDAGEKSAKRTMNCRVAFVNLKQVLEESEKGKKLKGDLEAERDKAFKPLKEKQKKLSSLEEKITSLNQEIMNKSPVWDNYTKRQKQNELQELYMQYNSLKNDLQLEKSRLQEDLNKKKNTMLGPLEKKMNEVMERIGSNGNYCLIMDVSPPSQRMPNFNPILYRNPDLDITDEVIKELDKKTSSGE